MMTRRTIEFSSIGVSNLKEQLNSSCKRIPHISLQMTSKQFLLVIGLFVSLLGICNGCNLDITKPIRYEGDSGDYFGYTVLQYENKISTTYVLIGAPRGNSEHQPTLDRPGKVYACYASDPVCEQLELDSEGNQMNSVRTDNKSNQWLGVSLSSQNRPDGLVSACGHRYANDIFIGSGDDPSTDRYLIGICYNFKVDTLGDADEVQRKFPCLSGDQFRPHDDTYLRWLSFCQAGIDTAVTSRGPSVLYGAPGAYNWTGTVVTDNDSGSFYRPGPEIFQDDEEFKADYSGYAVSFGHFVGPANDEQGVAGAPRAKEVGKVTIYDINNGTVYQEVYGEPLNTYFGGAVASIDLNSDGLSDLVVGAPMYSNDQEEGKVYVYLNTGSQREPLKLAQEIQGSKAFRARFGTSISGCGDINDDGLMDVIIGAPYEDNGSGAIYIYLGAEGGVDKQYSQRIVGSALDPPVTTFGISVHGGLDMDLNNYPDIVVGAHESDTAFLFKAKPIIQLEGWLELRPSSVDPEQKSCQLEGKDYVCLDVKACFRFSGVTPTFDLDIVYSIDVDEENTKLGIDARFLLTPEKLIHINNTIGIPEENVRHCADPIKAYLSEKARDLLTPVPMKLTYDVFKYPVVTSVRGDEPLPFPGGLPPVSNSYDCGAQYVIEKVIFVQNCGVDAICQTDLKLSVDAELPGGKQNELILGASPTLYINAKIDNRGEEAHQAVLKVYHPSDMGYEGVELEAVTCLPLAEERGSSCTAEVVATCFPQIGQDSSAIVECSLGNPMNAYNSATLRLRFDVSNIPWSQDREINITMVVYTVSIETLEEKQNNIQQLKLSVVVEADLGVVGTSQPESVYYGYNASSIGGNDQEGADKIKLKQALEAVNLFYSSNGDDSQYNQSHIGPAFNHEYQVVNYGPGRLPLMSNVTLQIPWRNVDGATLMFIKRIEIDTNKGSCNEARILDLQKRRIEEAYVEGSSQITYAVEEESSEQIATASDPRQLGCEKARCVDVSCNIALLDRDELVKITVEALLWEHTFVTRQYGFVDVVSQAKVQSDDPYGIHKQPDGHESDSKQIQTIAYTSTMGSEPVSWWVILLAILIGLLLLVIAVYVLWKLGFFKRELKEEMGQKGGYAQAPTTEAAN